MCSRENFKAENLWGVAFGLLAFGGNAAAAASRWVSGPALAAMLALPLLLALAGVATVARQQAKANEDHGHLPATLHGRFGNTPAALTIWVFTYTACVAVAGIGAVFHFPGVGNHYNFAGKQSALYTYIVDGECVDDGRRADGHCTATLCNMSRTGLKSELCPGVSSGPAENI